MEEQLSCPVARCGQIIDVHSYVSNDVAKNVKKSLTDRTNNYDDIRQIVESVAELCGGTLSSDEEGTFKWRTGSKRILESPNLLLNVFGYSVYCKICMTICGPERRSKIWVRYNVDNDVKTATESWDYEKLSDYFDDVARMCDHMNERLLTLYKSHLSHAGINLDKIEVYSLEAKGFDTTGDAPLKIYKHVSEGMGLVSAKNEIGAEKTISSALKLFRREHAVPNGDQTIEQMVVKAPLTEASIEGHVTDCYSGMFFIRFGSHATKIVGFGVIDDEKIDDTLKKHEIKSPALITTGLITEGYVLRT